MSRALALVLGGFLVANVLGEAVRPGFDQSVLLLDLRPLPASSSRPLLLALGALLVAFALRPAAGSPRRWATAGAAAALGLAALADSAVFYRVLAAGRIRTPLPVPLTLLAAAGFLAVARAAFRKRDPEPGDRLLLGGGAVAFALLFPLAQMQLFGRTDYSRPADAAVVFGAKVNADGSASTALADRVRTGVRLWREGRVRWLVLSGGPATGEVHETDVMLRLAREGGVPAEAILVDRDGTSTRETVAEVGAILDRIGARRVLAVSHAYHLPRVKMAFRRAGREVFTVPADESRRLSQMPRMVAREVVAFWAYWALFV